MCNDIFLLTGQVKHSYSVGKLPLHPWVAVRMNGSVECGHCTCMAGLAETCSHIAALLYWLETAVRIAHNTSCTSKENKWLCPSLPSACNDIPQVTLEELEKVSNAQKQKSSSKKQAQKFGDISCSKPSEEDLKSFYQSLSDAPDRKPAILSIIHPFSDRCVQSTHQLPTLLSSLYSTEALGLNYVQLLERVKELCYQPATDLQINHLEELTRGQSSNKKWFRYRAGRITASLFFQVFIIMYLWVHIFLHST